MLTTADKIAAALRPIAPGGKLGAAEVPLINIIAEHWDGRGGSAPPGAAAAPAAVHAFPISAIDVALLSLTAPHLAEAVLEPWVIPLRDACARFEINSIRRVAAFLGNLAHEGGWRLGRRENMNYSAVRLSQVWPGRFAKSKGVPNALALLLANKPEALANHVYANRMGNRGPDTGDGWRYRGNGPIQLTGHDNHAAFAKAMGMEVAAAAAWIESTFEGAVMSAAWFWEENDINRLADTPGVEDEARAINGGEIGLADRRRLFDLLVARLLELES